MTVERREQDNCARVAARSFAARFPLGDLRDYPFPALPPGNAAVPVPRDWGPQIARVQNAMSRDASFPGRFGITVHQGCASATNGRRASTAPCGAPMSSCPPRSCGGWAPMSAR